MVALAVLLAFHNRRAKTVAAVSAAIEAALSAGVEIEFYCLDDGSSDGTAESLQSLGARIHLLKGDGNFYWAKGMAIAERQALAAPHIDATIWLNDDVVIDVDSIYRLLQVVADHPNAVIAGATREPGLRLVSYSGMRRKGPHPLSFEIVQPTDVVQRIDTFNGNFVIVPRSVSVVVGQIDGDYSHALADIDYGIRCRNIGIEVLLAPNTYGECARNTPQPPRSALEDWRSFTGPKGGGNFKSSRRFLAKQLGFFWPFPLAVTYGLWWLRRFLNRWR